MTPTEECPAFSEIDRSFKSPEEFYQFVSSITPKFQGVNRFIDPIICIDRHVALKGKIIIVYDAPVGEPVIFGDRALCEAGKLLFESDPLPTGIIEVFGFNHSSNQMLNSPQFNLYKIRIANVRDFLACQSLSCMRAAYNSDYLWISLNTFLTLSGRPRLNDKARTYPVPGYYGSRSEFVIRNSPLAKIRYEEIRDQMAVFEKNWGFIPRYYDLEKNTSFVGHPERVVCSIDQSQSWMSSISADKLIPDCSILLHMIDVMRWFERSAPVTGMSPDLLTIAIAKYAAVGGSITFKSYLAAFEKFGERISLDLLPRIIDAYPSVVRQISLMEYLKIAERWPSKEITVFVTAVNYYDCIAVTNKEMTFSEYLEYIRSMIRR